MVRCFYFVDIFFRDGEVRGGMGWGDGFLLVIEEIDGRVEGVGLYFVEVGKYFGCLMCVGCVGNRVYLDSFLEFLTV